MESEGGREGKREGYSWMGARGKDTRSRKDILRKIKTMNDNRNENGGAGGEESACEYIRTLASGVGRRVCSVFKALFVMCGAMGETSTWTVTGS